MTLRWPESLFVCLLTVTRVTTMQHTPGTLKVPMNVAQSPDLLQDVFGSRVFWIVCDA